MNPVLASYEVTLSFSLAAGLEERPSLYLPGEPVKQMSYSSPEGMVIPVDVPMYVRVWLADVVLSTLKV